MENGRLFDPDKIYNLFQVVSHNPLFHYYLRWAYSQGIKDIVKTGNKIDFLKKNFTVLQCGTSGEITSEEFIKFVLRKNKKAKIYILDIGQRQIKAINNLVRTKYRNYNIKTLKINALDVCKYIRCQSVDLIETDGFLEYFSQKDLPKLLLSWKKLLTKDGFVITRVPTVRNRLEDFLYKRVLWVGRTFFGTDVYQYSDADLKKIFQKTGFRFVEGPTPLVFVLRRFLLLPNWGIRPRI
jgi:SAM-dependent methyltransferase